MKIFFFWILFVTKQKIYILYCDFVFLFPSSCFFSLRIGFFFSSSLLSSVAQNNKLLETHKGIRQPIFFWSHNNNSNDKCIISLHITKKKKGEKKENNSNFNWSWEKQRAKIIDNFEQPKKIFFFGLHVLNVTQDEHDEKSTIENVCKALNALTFLLLLFLLSISQYYCETNGNINRKEYYELFMSAYKIYNLKKKINWIFFIGAYPKDWFYTQKPQVNAYSDRWKKKKKKKNNKKKNQQTQW